MPDITALSDGGHQLMVTLSAAAANADVAPGIVDALTYMIVPIRPLDPNATPIVGRVELRQGSRTAKMF